MQYKHIFFDIDGTLCNSENDNVDAFYYIFKKYNLNVLCRVDFETFIKTYKDVYKDIIHLYNQNLIQEEFIYNTQFFYTLLRFNVENKALSIRIANDWLKYVFDTIMLYSNTKETLQELSSKGYALHIISNGFSEIQHNKLKKTDIINYFSQIIISGNHGFLKPDIRIYKKALKLAGAAKNESIMVGDNYKTDILGAKNAGLDQVYIDRNDTKLNATFVVSQLFEILDVF